MTKMRYRSAGKDHPLEGKQVIRIPRHKKSNGKLYKLFHINTNKKQAEKIAKEFRDSGWRVIVAKIGNNQSRWGHNPNYVGVYYALYKRKK